MKRSVSLDFLKVIATNLIVCHHFQQTLNVRFDKFINFFGGRFYFGYLVELFFVISGICAAKWISTMCENDTFPIYISKRIRRLLPLAALSVIVASVESLLYFKVHNVWLYDKPFDLAGAIFACMGIQAGWATENPMINNPLWYLSVLLLCYVLFYFVTWMAKRVNVSPYYFYYLIIFGGLGISTYGIDMPFMNGYSSRGYIAFFWGIVFARIMRQIDIHSRRIQFISIIEVSGMIFLIIIGYSINIIFLVTFILWPAVIIICYSPVVVKVLERGRIIWNFWAKVAFNMYIWHKVVLIAYTFIPSEKIEWFLTVRGMLLNLVIIQIIGLISYFCLEKPLENVFLKYDLMKASESAGNL